MHVLVRSYRYDLEVNVPRCEYFAEKFGLWYTWNCLASLLVPVYPWDSFSTNYLCATCASIFLNHPINWPVHSLLRQSNCAWTRYSGGIASPSYWSANSGVRKGMYGNENNNIIKAFIWLIGNIERISQGKVAVTLYYRTKIFNFLANLPIWANLHSMNYCNVLPFFSDLTLLHNFLSSCKTIIYPLL